MNFLRPLFQLFVSRGVPMLRFRNVERLKCKRLIQIIFVEIIEVQFHVGETTVYEMFEHSFYELVCISCLKCRSCLSVMGAGTPATNFVGKIALRTC